MQISMWVPYDENRLRRTLRFILRPQLRSIRILGVIVAVLGLGVAVLEPSISLAYVAVAVGLLCAVVIGPVTVARSVRMQSNVIKDGFHTTMDDEWITISYPLAETRFRWAGFDRVVETAEVWYVMFGQMQAVSIPKDTMTEQQRAEFSAFVNWLRSDMAARDRAQRITGNRW